MELNRDDHHRNHLGGNDLSGHDLSGVDLPYDALLLVSFGGPEGPDDVIPFLENVLRGRNVPRSRLLEVADHYQHFGGVSPLNAQNRALIAALEQELAQHGPRLPIYFGNRNWQPYLTDTLRQMAADGIRRSLAFFTSAFSSYSGCRQYRENIEAARAEVGANAPEVHKLRAFHNHPGYIEAVSAQVAVALAQVPADRRQRLRVYFTAHSIPLGMATTCNYESQLREASRVVAESLQIADWKLAYQSRSGPPQQPWLEPDIGDLVKADHAESPLAAIVVVPIGFVSDHIEVLYDLDDVVQHVCVERDIAYFRSVTASTHPRYVRMVRELIEERITPGSPRPTLGTLGPTPDVCPIDCCRYEPARPGPPGRP